MCTYRPFLALYHSRFLGNIKEAFDKNAAITNLLLDDFFKAAISDCQVCFLLIQGEIMHFLSFDLFFFLFFFAGVMEKDSCHGSPAGYPNSSLQQCLGFL